jgi:uncharacterized membrane protein YphA (DoxX/SURF4 family)
MKKINIAYWIFTILFAILMLFSSYESVLYTKNTVDIIHGAMGYPTYFIPYLGIVKILGVIAILVPGFPRVKEWAYFGLVFDIITASYSFAALSFPTAQWLPFMLLGLILGVGSYIFYHKRLKAATTAR